MAAGEPAVAASQPAWRPCASDGHGCARASHVAGFPQQDFTPVRHEGVQLVPLAFWFLNSNRFLKRERLF